MALLALAVSLSAVALYQSPIIQPGTKVFLQGMSGFEADLTVALIGAKVPIVVVKERKNAALEISGRHQRGRLPSERTEEATKGLFPCDQASRTIRIGSPEDHELPLYAKELKTLRTIQRLAERGRELKRLRECHDRHEPCGPARIEP